MASSSSSSLLTLALPLLAAASGAAAHAPLGPKFNHFERARSWREAHPQLAALDKREQTTPTKTTCPVLQAPAGLSGVLSSNYPKATGIATIVSGDSTAQNLYNQILGYDAYKAALAFPPAGSNMGDFSNVTYDSHTDPKCWWTSTTCHSPKQSYLETDTYYCPEPSTWGLSFDDGPFCDNEDFYAFLSRRALKATMFYIGINVYNNPVQAQRGLDDGHEICVHTWSHHYMTSLTNEEVFAELYYTKKIIKDVLGVTATCWRPPFGDTDDRVRTWAHALGMRTIIWDHDTFDWEIYTGTPPITAETIEQNYQYIYGNASDTSGHIILSHELNADTVAMFMGQWDSGNIQKAYKNIVPVGSCMNITHPYLETNVSFPTFAQFVSGNVNATHQSPFVSNAAISIVSVDPMSTAASGISASASKTGSGNSAAATDASGDSSSAGRTATFSIGALAAALLAFA